MSGIQTAIYQRDYERDAMGIDIKRDDDLSVPKIPRPVGWWLPLLDANKERDARIAKVFADMDEEVRIAQEARRR